MHTNRAAFNLQLTYALRPSGNYLAAVETLIADPEGRIVLRVTSDGPFVWAAEPFYWSDSQALQ